MPSEATGAARVLITLRSGSPEDLAHALRSLEGVDVITGAPESAIISPGSVTPVDVGVAEADAVETLPWRLSAKDKDGRSPLVLIRAVLDDRAATRLQDAGIAYVDASRRSWLPGQPPSPTARERTSSRPALRSGALRLAQLLADHPAREWPERALAERGGSSPVTAHKLLARLEDEGLVERTGPSARASRRVRSPAALRRWLADHGRPHRTATLSCYVRDPEGLPARIGHHLLVLTGAAAAERIGLPVLSGTARPSYRVDARGDELELLPRALGGFRTLEGANMTLVSDPGRLGLVDAHDHGDRLVAPPSRVMLDLYLESRGDAAAEVFLDLWGDRELEW